MNNELKLEGDEASLRTQTSKQKSAPHTFRLQITLITSGSCFIMLEKVPTSSKTSSFYKPQTRWLLTELYVATLYESLVKDVQFCCYRRDCESSLVAANVDESLHVFILFRLHSWKMSRLLVKITSVDVTNTAGQRQTFRWLRQTDASLTSWIECHVSSDTWSHTPHQQLHTERVQSRRGEVLVWLLRSWTERRSFLGWICCSEATAVTQRRVWILLPAASLTFSRAASPPLSYHVMFDPRQKDSTEVWTEAEGEGSDSCCDASCEDVRSGGVGAPSSSTVSDWCHISSSQLPWSPLHSVIISLPCSHFLLWGENQPDSVASSSSSSIHLSTFQQRVRQILHVSPSLLVSPHGLRPSLLLQRFVWEVVLTSTPLLSSLSETCEVIISFL